MRRLKTFSSFLLTFTSLTTLLPFLQAAPMESLELFGPLAEEGYSKPSLFNTMELNPTKSVLSTSSSSTSTFDASKVTGALTSNTSTLTVESMPAVPKHSLAVSTHSLETARARNNSEDSCASFVSCNDGGTIDDEVTAPSSRELNPERLTHVEQAANKFVQQVQSERSQNTNFTTSSSNIGSLNSSTAVSSSTSTSSQPQGGSFDILRTEYPLQNRSINLHPPVPNIEGSNVHVATQAIVTAVPLVAAPGDLSYAVVAENAPESEHENNIDEPIALVVTEGYAADTQAAIHNQVGNAPSAPLSPEDQAASDERAQAYRDQAATASQRAADLKQETPRNEQLISYYTRLNARYLKMAEAEESHNNQALDIFSKSIEDLNKWNDYKNKEYNLNIPVLNTLNELAYLSLRKGEAYMQNNAEAKTYADKAIVAFSKEYSLLTTEDSDLIMYKPKQRREIRKQQLDQLTLCYSRKGFVYKQLLEYTLGNTIVILDERDKISFKDASNKAIVYSDRAINELGNIIDDIKKGVDNPSLTSKFRDSKFAGRNYYSAAYALIDSRDTPEQRTINYESAISLAQHSVDYLNRRSYDH